MAPFLAFRNLKSQLQKASGLLETLQHLFATAELKLLQN
jgi:hypothetical protein